MRITFQTSGGMAYFPGLAQPTVIDTEELPATEAEQLQQLIDAADFQALPQQLSQSSSRGRDMRTYTISVAEGKKKHTVQFSDPIPEELAPLVAALRAKSRE